MLSLDLCTSLAHMLECQWDLLLFAARYAVLEDVNVIAVQEKAQGGLQEPDMGLRSVDPGDRLLALIHSTTYLDVPKDETRICTHGAGREPPISPLRREFFQWWRG